MTKDFEGQSSRPNSIAAVLEDRPRPVCCQKDFAYILADPLVINKVKLTLLSIKEYSWEVFLSQYFFAFKAILSSGYGQILWLWNWFSFFVFSHNLFTKGLSPKRG